MADTIVALPLSGSFSGATVPIKAVDNGDGTYSLSTSGTAPVGGATAANQATQITAEQGILAKLPASLGAKAPSASLSAVGAQSSAAPTNAATTPFTVLTADGDVFTLAAGEIGYIQNHDDAVLNFKLGTGASPSSLSGRLKACVAQDDASGGDITIKSWIGVVSVAAVSGTPRYSAWKI